MSAPSEWDRELDTDVYRTNVCPVKGCAGRRTEKIYADQPAALAVAKAWGNKSVAPLRKCLDCGAIWEPWDRGTPTDTVERARVCGACDNCAYRAGSRESLDRGEREDLERMARESAEGIPKKVFSCHKGIPIVITESGIRFAWEHTDVEIRSQLCVGYLRLLWDERRRLGLPVGVEDGSDTQSATAGGEAADSPGA